MNAVYALAFMLTALALGTFSSILFVWQWTIGGPSRFFATMLSLVIVAAFAKVFFYLNQRMPRVVVPENGNWIVRRLPAVCVFGGAIYVAISAVRQLQNLPHGGWDAFAVWNAHARFLFRGSSGEWQAIFDPAMSWGHNEYPLLLPGLVNGVWTLTGGDSPLVPAILGVLFAALGIGLLCSAASALAQDERGHFAGLLLLATPSFLLSASFQMADIPISLYILTTVVLLQFADAWPNVRRPLLLLAGLSAGFAVWTKNEGLLFVVAIFASHLASFAIMRAWRQLRDNAVMIGIGVVPALILIFAFKSVLAPGVNPVDTFQHVDSPARYAEILSGFLDQAKGFGGTWHTGGIHPAVLLVLFLFIYKAPIRNVTATSLSLLLLVLFMLGGYFMIYLFSSGSSVRGYIGGSLDRLYLQLWPASLFILATFSLRPRGDLQG